MRKHSLLAFALKQLKQPSARFLPGFIFLVVLTHNAAAQDFMGKPVSISVNQVGIAKVINLLEDQAKVDFVYSPNAIQASRKISCSARDKKLGQFLDDVFKPLDIGYKTSEDQIILFNSQPQKQLTLASFEANGVEEADPKKAFLFAIITGIIRDDKGAFLQGVTVTEKGTKNSTLTDASGHFSINVRNANAVLVFSSIGFSTREQVVGRETVFNMALTSTSAVGEEVIIVGYGKQKKINNTGAVSTIGTKELIQSPVANISNSLVGRLPGLFATQSGGEPGNDGSTIRIRGVGTFTGNTNPLVLVDGIEVASYNNIDPNEIESLTILKDASSTAVYGIRGANGVIIITTKRGKSGPPKISYTFNQGFNSFTDKRTSMDGADYAISYNAGQKADAYTSGSIYTPLYTQTDIDLFRSGADPIFHPNHNWVNELFRDVSSQSQHNLNISGGSSKVRYFISGGFFNQQGLFKDLTNVVSEFNAQSTYRRYNIRSNFNFDISDRLKMTLDLSTQTEVRSGNNNVSGGAERVVGDIFRASPIEGPGIVDGKIVNINIKNNNPYGALLYPNQAGGVKRSYRNYLNGSLRLDYDLGFIIPGLSTHGNVAIQTFNDQTINNNKLLITYMAYPINGGPINGGTVTYVPSATETQFGFAQAATYNRRITAEAGIDYKKSLGLHNITGLVAYNQQKTYDPSFQFLVPRGYQSLIGRATYDYNSKYLVEVNLGYNGSENFAPGKRFGLFPAYSVGWVASQESFFPKGFISFLKVRASYGEVGYDQIGGNRFLYNPTSYSLYTAASIYYYGNIGSTFTGYQGLREGGTGNPDVTWERKVAKNLGLEMRLWKNRISITADLFQENRNNILAVPQTISAVAGLIQPSKNLGKMQNRGYEGEISFTERVGQVGLRFSGNYSFAKNKVLFRDEIPPLFEYQRRTGQRLGQNFALICDGIFNTWDEVNDAKRPVYQGTNKIQPGDLKYRDVNGDGIINDFDAVPMGYSNVPEKTYGVSLSANYKGFDISVLFQGVGNVSLYYTRFQKNAGIGGAPPEGSAAYLIESWTPERYAAGLPISFPRFSLVSNSNGFGSSFFLADASYLRLKNMEVGYTARPNMLRRMGITSLRIYANANNLLTWKHVYQGIDPENTSTGDTNTEPYPLVRTINAGININF